MSKKQITLIAVSVSLFFVAVVGAWFFLRTDSAISPIDLFPGESGVRPIEPPDESSDPLPDDDVLPPPQQDLPQRRLYELHKAPVAGVGLIETKDKKGIVTSVTARYIERGLGHIFESPLSPLGQEMRIVNETRPRLAEALWGNGGKSVAIRYVDDKNDGIIATSIINIAPQTSSFNQGTSTDSSLSSFFKTEEVNLPDGIPFMSVAEDGSNSLFYLLRESGITATFKDTGISKIFSSPFTEWLPQFPNQKLITLTSKPSAKVHGALFFVNPQTKSSTKILGGINGLTTLTSPNGKIVLFSETKASPELSLYDVSKKESRMLYLQTLPEKCAWGKKLSTIVYCAVPSPLPKGSYPDQWYQGLVSFSDELWEIDSVTSVGRKIMDTKSMGAPTLDMINLSVSSQDTHLVFMNKVTGTPWVYRLVNEIPLVREPSVAPQRVVSSPTEPASTSSSPATAISTSVIGGDMKRLR